jgi:hypothetical protein
MAKIYNLPDGFEAPKLNFSKMDEYRTACAKLEEDLKAWLLKRNNAEHVGEIIRFPVADGYAEYMVAALKPVELVHLPLWDAWDFQYAHRLTAKDVKEKIQQAKALQRIFPAK